MPLAPKIWMARLATSWARWGPAIFTMAVQHPLSGYALAAPCSGAALALFGLALRMFSGFLAQYGRRATQHDHFGVTCRLLCGSGDFVVRTFGKGAGQGPAGEGSRLGKPQIRTTAPPDPHIHRYFNAFAESSIRSARDRPVPGFGFPSGAGGGGHRVASNAPGAGGSVGRGWPPTGPPARRA